MYVSDFSFYFVSLRLKGNGLILNPTRRTKLMLCPFSPSRQPPPWLVSDNSPIVWELIEAWWRRATWLPAPDSFVVTRSRKAGAVMCWWRVADSLDRNLLTCWSARSQPDRTGLAGESCDAPSQNRPWTLMATELHSREWCCHSGFYAHLDAVVATCGIVNLLQAREEFLIRFKLRQIYKLFENFRRSLTDVHYFQPTRRWRLRLQVNTEIDEKGAHLIIFELWTPDESAFRETYSD